MDNFNVNELASTVISQAHSLRRLEGETAELVAENAELKARLAAAQAAPTDNDGGHVHDDPD